MTYDKNGNIQTLQRNGDFDWDATSGPLQIDNLSYFYDTNNPNQLTKVSDSTNNPKGFVDGTNDDNDYAYDANGNMIYDKNKTIENIRYNHLNLPTQIIFSSGNIINYLYNAIGQKVRKTVRVDGTGLETYYLDGFQYSGGKLRFFPHAEGYVTASYCESEQCDMSVPRQLSYVYNYTDHLGNIRLSYGYDPKAEQLKILEENHYYPFGLKHTNYSNYRKKYSLEEVLANEQNSNWQNLPSTQAKQTVLRIKQIITGESVAYNYKYNGKEFQDELGLNLYDYGARNYDPAIGRWMNVDNMSEKYHSTSPYTYVNNNPIIYIDLDGNEWYYHSVDGKADPTWNWHDGSSYNTGVKDSNGTSVVLTGVEAVVVFNGSRDEKLGTKNGKGGYINGKGAVTADVTLYGPKCPDDIHHFIGYTMSSNAEKFGAIDEGTYNGNYDKEGKSGALESHWAINNRGRVRTLDGEINPFVPSQIDGNCDGYKTGIFIHCTNKDGFAGEIHEGTSGISVGCLLISPSNWSEFNKCMSGVKDFKVQVQRTVTNGKNTALKKD